MYVYIYKYIHAYIYTHRASMCASACVHNNVYVCVCTGISQFLCKCNLCNCITNPRINNTTWENLNFQQPDDNEFVLLEACIQTQVHNAHKHLYQGK
jgi:hypothetical protein